MGTEERCSWSDLPHCLLELILECSTLLTDRLRFSFVCRSWHAVQTQWGRSQLPFFVLRSTINETSIEFFSPLQRRSYKTPIPPPLTEVRHCPSLGFTNHPPMVGCCLSTVMGRTTLHISSSMPPLINGWVCLPMPKRFVSYIDCLFFSTPSDPNGVLFIRKSDNSFMLHRLNYSCRPWLHYYEREENYERGGPFVSNTIFFEGKLYSLKKDWSLWIANLLFPKNAITLNLIINTTSFKIKKKPAEDKLPLCRERNQEFMLVESCGEMLLVKIPDAHCRSIRFNVFRADLSNLVWVEVKNLDDRMLFLSGKSSVSICTTTETGWEGNRIYFIPGGFQDYDLILNGNEDDNDLYLEYELDKDKLTYHHTDPLMQSAKNSGVWITPGLP